MTYQVPACETARYQETYRDSHDAVPQRCFTTCKIIGQKTYKNGGNAERREISCDDVQSRKLPSSVRRRYDLDIRGDNAERHNQHEVQKARYYQRRERGR